MIRAVVSDFGGVLTSPLSDAFRAFADRSASPLAMFGEAFEALHGREGGHRLHELECGRMAEAVFVSELQRALCEASGSEVSLAGFAELLTDPLPNEPTIELLASLGGRRAGGEPAGGR